MRAMVGRRAHFRDHELMPTIDIHALVFRAGMTTPDFSVEIGPTNLAKVFFDENTC